MGLVAGVGREVGEKVEGEEGWVGDRGKVGKV